MHILPFSKRQNTTQLNNPLPKVEVPKEKSDYRGINVTPVIARVFEKVVFNAHARDVVEENLNASKFSREGGSCTDALIALPHVVNQSIMWSIPLMLF